MLTNCERVGLKVFVHRRFVKITREPTRRRTKQEPAAPSSGAACLHAAPHRQGSGP